MNGSTHDLVIIGAGPAGLAAASTAAGLGLNTIMVDEQATPGGQIYRGVTQSQPWLRDLLGPDYRRGADLVRAVEAASIEHRIDTLAWDVTHDLAVLAQRNGLSFRVRGPQLIAATGAMERATPVPGWTLPGVLNVGAAQIALKTGGAVPAGRVWLAGSGPLLLLVAAQLLRAGADLRGIVETTPPGNLRDALRHLPGLLADPRALFKGMGWTLSLRRSGMVWHRRASHLRIEGDERVAALRFECNGREHKIDADAVLLHHGVVPNTQLTRLLRVEHDWNAVQQAWQPRVDAWGETTLAGFRVAGDGAGIGGALAAEARGALAALGAAHALGRIDTAERDRLAAPLRSDLARHLRPRPFLDALYRPPAWLAAPPDETIVCRCESVTAGRIREMAKLGCQGPNQTKFFSRCGMGPCQGRQCGIAVTQILAQARGRPESEVGAYRIRPPLKPITLASLAALDEQSTP